jgi:hypothetical protein
VFPGKNGFLATPGNQTEFLEAIRRACMHPLFSKGALDAVTHTQTRAYLSPQRMAHNFLAAYGAATKIPADKK